MFDQTIPAPNREYVQGNLCSILLSDLSKMRQSARFFTWQMKLASQAKNHDRAMQAWQRSERIVEYLMQEKSLIGSLVMIALETIRLEGLEYMLAAGFLSDQELESIQKYLLKSAGKMPEVNRNALYFEAVFGTDTLIGMAKGAVRNNGRIMHEGLAGYRFLVPGLWYLGMKNYSSLLKFYNKKNLCQADEKIERNSYNIFSCMLIPALKSGGERMHDMEMRYQAFYALLEAIKIKRTTGKYPAELPVKITDYFSGKPLLYKAGSFDVQAVKLVERKKSADDGEWFNSNRKYESDYTYKAPAVQGIAVWSVGRNKVNDHGAVGRIDVDGKTVRCDDIRALLKL